jgi:hypothetical protein
LLAELASVFGDSTAIASTPAITAAITAMTDKQIETLVRMTCHPDTPPRNSKVGRHHAEIVVRSDAREPIGSNFP